MEAVERAKGEFTPGPSPRELLEFTRGREREIVAIASEAEADRAIRRELNALGVATRMYPIGQQMEDLDALREIVAIARHWRERVDRAEEKARQWQRKLVFDPE